MLLWIPTPSTDTTISTTTCSCASAYIPWAWRYSGGGFCESVILLLLCPASCYILSPLTQETPVSRTTDWRRRTAGKGKGKEKIYIPVEHATRTWRVCNYNGSNVLQGVHISIQMSKLIDLLLYIIYRIWPHTIQRAPKYRVQFPVLSYIYHAPSVLDICRIGAGKCTALYCMQERWKFSGKVQDLWTALDLAQ